MRRPTRIPIKFHLEPSVLVFNAIADIHPIGQHQVVRGCAILTLRGITCFTIKLLIPLSGLAATLKS